MKEIADKMHAMLNTYQDCPFLSSEDLLTLTDWYSEGNHKSIIGESDIIKSLNMLYWLRSSSVDSDLYSFSPQHHIEIVNAFSKQFELDEQKSDRMIYKYLSSEGAIRRKSIIICIEGLDGAGKTVQTNMLKDYIQNSGFRVDVIDFPQYDSFFGKEIGCFLSGRMNIDANSIDAKSMCLWFAVDRWKKLSQINMQQIDYLILNRYTLSSAVYQCARYYKNYNQEFIDWVFKLEHEEFFLPIPNIYLVLDIDPNESKKNNLLKEQREYLGKGTDVYENSHTLQINARKIYRDISNNLKNVKIIDCMNNAKILSMEHISKKIIRELSCYGISL